MRGPFYESSHRAVVAVFGYYDVRVHKKIKTWENLFGHQLEVAIVDALGGQLGRQGEPDAFIAGVAYEIRTSRNGKNSHGEKADRSRGVTVTAVGRPAPGSLSLEELCRSHNHSTATADSIRWEAFDATNHRLNGLYGQLELFAA